MFHNLICTCLFIFSIGLAVAQTNFNQYQTLLSKGSIPKDISLSTPEKIKIAIATDRPELEMKYRKSFYTGIYYSIDELLHSEICVFGDEVTQYVADVAKKILKDDPQTYNELRFYTLKTNETNALSTDQGVIFVTTGLLSQITSEAQLALVLAHEIAHYKRKHVLERFKQKVVMTNPTLYQLSSYSKEKELEADADGLKMYKNAGYPADLVEPTFDVLMYSYLPFDEEKIGELVFNTHEFVVPSYIYPKEKFEITAEENYDDSKSSHPNISKRKGQANKIIEKDHWEGGEAFQLGEERFRMIQRIARFEVVRSGIINGDLTNALYSLTLLEKEEPNSLYLHRMKAKIWLTLAQCKSNGVTKPFDSKKHKEGEIAVLHSMLRKFDKAELATIALRHVYDLQKANPEDQEIQHIYKLMVACAATTKNFSLDRYSKYSLEEGIAKWKKNQDSIAALPKDTLAAKETTNTGSKYDRIKKKRNADQSIDGGDFDSTNYYLYGMYDVISDHAFVELFKDSKTSSEPEKVTTVQNGKEKAPYFKLAAKEKFVLLEPNVVATDVSATSQEIVDQIAIDFPSALTEIGTEKGLTIETDRSPTTLSIEGLNDMAIFKTLLTENETYERINFSPVDFTYLQDIKKETESNIAVIPNILFVDHRRSNPMEIARPALIFWYLPPVALTGALAKLATSKNTFINFIEINLSTGKANETQVLHVTGKPNKLRLGSVFYEIL